MIKILLSKGFIASLDEEDLCKIDKYRWHLHKSSNTNYAAAGSITPEGKKVTLMLHRLIMNAPDNLDVDHIDGNGLNNTKTNLRLATRSQNNMNRVGKSKTSPYKGVCWDKSKQRYMAQIAINNSNKYIGRFTTAIEAALAYDKKAIELHGEFAKLNFPLTKYEKPANIKK